MAKQYIDTTRYGKFYYKDPAKTIRHREDGPAVEDVDGHKAWYVNGKAHRLDGPAYEDASGEKVWYVNGELHRLDGPAIEYADGVKSWYVNGIFIFNVDTKGNIQRRMR